MSKRQLLITLVKVTFLGFLFYFCLQFFLPRWESLQLSNRLEMLSVPWIVAAAIFTFGYCALGFLVWKTILRNLGSQPDLCMITRAYVFSLLAKYIPGNVAAHGLRTQLAMRAGVPVLVSMNSFLFEAIFAVGTAGVISIPGTMYYFPEVLNPFSTWLFAAFALVLIAFMAARRFRSVNIKWLHTTLARPKGHISVLFLYLLLWLVSGIAHWCLANSLGSYSLSLLPQLIVAVSASWVLGFVSIFAPAGLGVREAVLYFFVTNWMEQADVLLFVTLSRLLMFAVEVFLTVAFMLYRKLAHRTEGAMTK